MSSADASSSLDQDIQINIKGPSELKLQIEISTDKTVLDLKKAIAEKSDVPADRQRLIYSGRVLKDDDALTAYKIATTHTVHMVKGAAKPGDSSGSGSTGTAPQVLPNMQSGQNVHDPLTQLNSHLGFGALNQLGPNPFENMGLNPNDPNMMQGMFENPQFLQTMSASLSNPAVIDQIVAMNPQLAGMGPQLREVFQSERFRQMISDPQQLRMMMQMAQMTRGMGGGAGGMGDPFGGMGGFGQAPSFPAPGQPSAANNGSNPPSSTANPSSPGTTSPSSAPGSGAFPPMFPFGPPAGGSTAPDPAAMQNLMAALGGMGGIGGMSPGGFGGMGGAGGFSGLGGAASPPPPSDTRSPEERFQVQLQQLQDMGFSNAQQNVRALLATGGNVHSAIEYILGGGGL